MRNAWLLALVCWLAQPATADVTLAGLFRDHAVLQRDMQTPVWGFAEPGEAVTVSIAGQHHTTTADEDGQWLVRLNPLPAGGPHALTVNDTTLQNILIGDVWLATGQSNMVMAVAGMDGAQEAMDSAADPNIRLFTVERLVSTDAKHDIAGGAWQQGDNPRAVRQFSAVGYSFARKVHRETGVPIGMIACCVGATMVEHWVSPAVLQSQDDFDDDVTRRYGLFLDQFKDSSVYPDFANNVEAYYNNAYDEMRRINRARAKKEKLPDDINEQYAMHKRAWKVYKSVPSGLYNAMLKPMIPYGIRGALWYQGESNDDLPDVYARLLPAMIQSWRDEWDQGDFPFYIVSLAAFRAEVDQPTDTNWPRIREVHWNTQHKLPNVGAALAIDLGDADDIHPKRKRPVGERLARIALANVYDKDVAWRGPVFDEMTIDGNTVRITFDHAAGLTTDNSNPPATFAIAGADRVWHWADARIDGNSVVLQSDAVAQPVAVRYGWADNPPVNLYNAAGLPAVPFRTDDWPRQP